PIPSPASGGTYRMPDRALIVNGLALIPERNLAYSSDGSLLAVYSANASGHSVLRVWDLQSNRVLLEHNPENDPTIHDLSFDPDGSRLIACVNDARANWVFRSWDMLTKRERPSVVIPSRSIRAAISPDGSRLAAVDPDGTV